MFVFSSNYIYTALSLNFKIDFNSPTYLCETPTRSLRLSPLEANNLRSSLGPFSFRHLILYGVAPTVIERTMLWKHKRNCGNHSRVFVQPGHITGLKTPGHRKLFLHRCAGREAPLRRSWDKSSGIDSFCARVLCLKSINCKAIVAFSLR